MPAGASSLARAFLRHLLSAYLQPIRPLSTSGMAPTASLTWRTDPEIRFNLSHADDTATMASRCSAKSESISKPLRAMSISMPSHDKRFHPPELRALNSLAPAARRDAFYRIWMRKEAYVKARGEGLSYPTQSFTVSHLPMDDDALRIDDQDGGALSDWRVAEIPAPAGFHAALAAKGCDWSVLQLDASAFAPR